MGISILDFPPEILQHVALYASLSSPLGPPKELVNCLLTCRTFHEKLSPKNAGELHHVVFAQKFDIQGPVYRLGPSVVREHAPFEMQRRFRALQIFKNRAIYHSELTEALWIAYIMVEDSDTSQKNVKQLFRAHLPSFLDSYLRQRLYEGAVANNGWPVINEQNSLAIALSWTLAYQMAISSEDIESCREMMRILEPIVFAGFRYSVLHTHVSSFNLGTEPRATSWSSFTNDNIYPISIIPPQEISYFGTVHRKARAPAAAIFATLLYFVRAEKLFVPLAPPHLKCRTREEANAMGRVGPCLDDFVHFYSHCRTRFADFPGIDIGIHSSAMASSPNTVLCQPSIYRLGTLSGQWQGGILFPDLAPLPPGDHMPGAININSRNPLYITLQEHFCCEESAAVPYDESEHNPNNAWLPPDLVVVETAGGMQFRDGRGTFNTTYETLHRVSPNMRGRKVVDVIITGKTEDQYLAAWGGGTKILGRVRLYDGLMIIVRYNPLNTERQVLRGYVTSSQNLVGRLSLERLADTRHYYEGVFSLGKNHTIPTKRPPTF